MRHQWEDAGSYTARRPFQKWRRCKNCGKEQQQQSRHLWGRVVGYFWTPKAGRCQVAKSGDGGAGGKQKKRSHAFAAEGGGDCL